MTVLAIMILGCWFAAYGSMNTADFIYWLMILAVMSIALWLQFADKFAAM